MKKVFLIFSLSFFISSSCLFAQKTNFGYYNNINKPVSVYTNDTNNIDVSIFRRINNSRSPFLDFAVPVTDRSVLPAAIVIPTAMFFIARSNDNNYDENSSVLLGLSEATSFLVTAGVKLTVKRERPYKILKNVYSDEASTLGDPHSFPSGHSAMAFSMATSLTLRYNDSPLLIAGMFTYASAVALGRIYLGVHYPSDVLGGMLIGSGSAILIYSLRKEIFKAKNNLLGENKIDTKDKSINGSIIFGGIVAADIINHFISKSSSSIIRSSSLSASSNGFNFRYNF